MIRIVSVPSGLHLASCDLAQFEIIIPTGRFGDSRGAESRGMLQNYFVDLG